MKLPTASALALVSLARLAHADSSYGLSESIVGERFYDAFDFDAVVDPTHGRVNYVDAATAQNSNLTYATGNVFVMRADDTTTLSSDGPGRNSVRLRSKNQYTTHAVVFDVSHMPEGCGTWPRVLETGQDDWPSSGEVDIIEGVNDVEPNQSTLHTSSGCSIPSSGVTQRGTTATTNCDVSANDNSGCGVKLTEDNNSFGPGFNSVGGGWYTFERTNDHMSVWFWRRGDASAPSDVTSGASTVNPSNWGAPAAHFPNTDCNLETHFKANNIFIDLTFCGDWAGKAYSSSGCPSDCIDFVNNNPTAFKNAYFEFKSIRIYE